MRKSGFVVATIGVATFLAAGLVEAETETIRALVQITMNLNHYPSDEEKSILNAIIESNDSSEEEAAIAMALANMEHKVTAADAERLADIVDDDFSNDAARKLASILLNINHSPSDEDKVNLASLAE
ncbi:MAG: hypothetical protein OEQ39_20800 [Gammaproteobacteria bacterium]|nr:hypothetical protein [Gammaproteobacteria bacterium]MDH3379373.1 hypothetical protein [Gammaproteobacteria bacterium]